MIQKNNGDVLAFDTGFDYRGPATTNIKMRCVIGRRGVSFDEIQYTDSPLSMPKTDSWTHFTLRRVIQLAGLQPGDSYDVYCKIYSGLTIYQMWELVGAVQVPEQSVSEFDSLTVSIS